MKVNYDEYDFSGYATRNDLECADGRIIRHDAFRDNDGMTVPLVYQHVHNDPKNVVGHALLENRGDGVYCYGKFNDTENGRHAKQMVFNRDITALSIYANRLKQHGPNVVHGMIREVSLVLTGANPGAYIEDVAIKHSDGSVSETDEACIFPMLEDGFTLYHSDDKSNHTTNDDKSTDEEDDMANKPNDGEKTVQDVFDTFTDEQKDVVYFLIGNAVENGSIKHADDDDDDDDADEASSGDKTIKDVFDSFTEEQKNVVYFLIGQAMEDQGAAKHGDFDDDYYDGYDDYDGGYSMKHNLFDSPNEEGYDMFDIDAVNNAIAHAATDRSVGSLKAYMEEQGFGDLVLEHAAANNIQNIDVLYPEARAVRTKPDMVTRNQDWVTKFWNALYRTPFAHTKSIAADFTEDEARAKGYITGDQKLDQVYKLLARDTTPQTVYKRQTIDRDKLLDITTLDMAAFTKEEMRMLLIEELCRAMLVADGRVDTSRDKIDEEKIRPIYQDDDFYTIHYAMEWDSTATQDEITSTIIDSAIIAADDYRGTGNPIFFAPTTIVSKMRLAKDKIGRPLYNDMNALANAMDVREVVKVPVMNGVTRTVTKNGVTKTYELYGIIVNPGDYTVGTDKGGAVTFFDDFDIDYNQQKFLLETRCSGALTIPYSAIALEREITNP